jgi:DNA-directed RNA polymerase I, II, and III subunit RPABC2
MSVKDKRERSDSQISDDDIGSNYDADDVEDDVEIDDLPNAKVDIDDEDDELEDDYPVVPKLLHTYHQVPESTEIIIVPVNQRITSEYMTIYEYSMVVGTRATHIANGSTIYVDPHGLSDARDIAKKEINQNKCPLSVTRKISPTKLEIWEVNEMIKPQM